jgi:hypothetical protein
VPQGDKSSYTGKQKRQAKHIETGYKKKGLSTKTSKARAWGHCKQTHRRRQAKRVRQKEVMGEN